MPPTAMPLSDLARRLARKESEVQKLRRLYETRLANLQSRRQQLAEKLRALEAEIQSVTQASPEPAAGPTPTAEPAPSKPGPKRGTLPALLVKLIQRAGQPLTIAQLVEEVRRRKFPTKSKNIPGLIQARVHDLVKGGVLAHAHGQPGYVVTAANGQHMGSQAKARTKGRPGRKAKVANASAGAAGRGGQPPLREVLTKILEQCQEPIGGGELAQKVLTTGYKSKSKSFKDVVWVNLGNMKNVEHVPGKGYRLKKR